MHVIELIHFGWSIRNFIIWQVENIFKLFIPMGKYSHYSSWDFNWGCSNYFWWESFKRNILNTKVNQKGGILFQVSCDSWVWSSKMSQSLNTTLNSIIWENNSLNKKQIQVISWCFDHQLPVDRFKYCQLHFNDFFFTVLSIRNLWNVSCGWTPRVLFMKFSADEKSRKCD